jgi:hypothetical protein
MEGWIKLHRRFLEWEWYDDNNTKILFLHLLLKANHKDKKYRGQIVKRGCLLTGRELLSKETGMSVMQIRTSLTKLKSTNELTIKSSSQGTEIQVVKYNDYQIVTNELTNEQPTSNQRVTTNKNVKKEKNEKNIYRAFDHLNIFQDEFIKLNKVYSKQQIDSILDDIENFKGNTKYKSLYLTANNWLSRKYPNQESKEDKTKNFINNL